ncbi:ribonuclease-like [Pelodiscus sinensis]|uniref:ribonuclease-like n=1 Tax=Pelodiscus sinensis TaxID=13735 RepID=UPI003F6B3288
MALRGPCVLLLLTLALLAVGLAQLIPQPPNYQRFVRENVDYPRTGIANAHRYCSTMIMRRGLPCPFSHTFIHTSPRQLQSVCTRNGRCRRPGNQCDSHRAFPLTTCRRVATSRPSGCVYRGRQHTNRVRLACRRQLPVSFIRYL